MSNCNCPDCRRRKRLRAGACQKEMFYLLSAINSFWKDGGGYPAPLHPGALLTDRNETIQQLVRNAVQEASYVFED